MEETKREHRDLGGMGKVIEVDAAGAALTPETVASIEEKLAPLRTAGFTHVDLLVKRVSIQHLSVSKNRLFQKRADPTVVVEAIEFHGNFDEVEKFVGGDAEFRDGKLLVATSEGPLWASPYEWIVKKDGKFQTLPRQIFLEVYREGD